MTHNTSYDIVCHSSQHNDYPHMQYSTLLPVLTSPVPHILTCTCTLHFHPSLSVLSLEKKTTSQKGRNNWVIHSFPLTPENVHRLYPRPQLGLPFPFPLTCTSHVWLLQEPRWRRTNMLAVKWMVGPAWGLGLWGEGGTGCSTLPASLWRRLEKLIIVSQGQSPS